MSDDLLNELDMLEELVEEDNVVDAEVPKVKKQVRRKAALTRPKAATVVKKPEDTSPVTETKELSAVQQRIHAMSQVPKPVASNANSIKVAAGNSTEPKELSAVQKRIQAMKIPVGPKPELNSVKVAAKPKEDGDKPKELSAVQKRIQAMKIPVGPKPESNSVKVAAKSKEDSKDGDKPKELSAVQKKIQAMKIPVGPKPESNSVKVTEDAKDTDKPKEDADKSKEADKSKDIDVTTKEADKPRELSSVKKRMQGMNIPMGSPMGKKPIKKVETTEEEPEKTKKVEESPSKQSSFKLPFMGKRKPTTSSKNEENDKDVKKETVEEPTPTEKPKETAAPTPMTHKKRAKPVGKKKKANVVPVALEFNKNKTMDVAMGVIEEVAEIKVVEVEVEPKRKILTAKESKKEELKAQHKYPKLTRDKTAPLPTFEKKPRAKKRESVALNSVLASKWGLQEIDSLETKFKSWKQTQTNNPKLEDLENEIIHLRANAETMQSQFEAVKTEIRMARGVILDSLEEKTDEDLLNTYANFVDFNLPLKQTDVGINRCGNIVNVSAKFVKIARNFTDEWKKAIAYEQALLGKEKVPDMMMSTSQAMNNFLTSMNSISTAMDEFATGIEQSSVVDLNVFTKKASLKLKVIDKKLSADSSKLNKMLNTVQKQKTTVFKDQRKLMGEKLQLMKFLSENKDLPVKKKVSNLKDLQSLNKKIHSSTTELYKNVDQVNEFREQYNSTLLDCEKLERVRIKTVGKCLNKVGHCETKFGQAISASGRMLRQMTTGINANADIRQFVSVGTQKDGNATLLETILPDVDYKPEDIEVSKYLEDFDDILQEAGKK